MDFISNNILDSHMIINIIMNVGLISIFIAIFFFTYASTVEQDIVKEQTIIVINDLMQLANPFLSNEVKKQIYDNIRAPDLSKEDEEVLHANSKLKMTAYTNLAVVFVIALILCLVLAHFYKHDLLNMLKLNLILVVLVGITEFTFLHFVPHKFISADTNWVRGKILSSIKEKFKFV